MPERERERRKREDKEIMHFSRFRNKSPLIPWQWRSFPWNYMCILLTLYTTIWLRDLTDIYLTNKNVWEYSKEYLNYIKIVIASNRNNKVFRRIDMNLLELIRYEESECQTWFNANEMVSPTPQDHIMREVEELQWAMENMLQHSICQSFGMDCKHLIAIIKDPRWDRLP